MFGDLIKDIIKSNNRDDIFDFLLQMNDSSVEVNVASDTQLLIYSSKLDDFFEDESLFDGSFDKSKFITNLLKVETRLTNQGEAYYTKMFILLKFMVDEGKVPDKSILIFLQKLYNDYNY